MKLFTLSLFLMFLLPGCATILSGSKNTVDIRTDPPAADIVILDRKGQEVFSGKSQAVVRLKTGAGYFVPAVYTVKINAPGYQERVVRIRSTINGLYFANIFIGGALGMLIIDPATGAMWKLKDIAIDEKLDKPNTSTSIKLQITDIRNLSEEQKHSLVKIR